MKKNAGYLVDFINDTQVTVSKNESILQASLNAGIPHFHICGGHAKCSTCRVLVIEGGSFLSPPNKKEQSLNRKMHFPPNVRLACQTHICGSNVKIKRIIRDENDIEIYVGKTAGLATQQMGEEVEMALFFLDVKDFTPFVGSHLAFDVIHIIRKLFGQFHFRIEENMGKILETTGDGLYAVFGSGTQKKTKARQAVRAAQQILSDLEELNENYFKINFKQRIDVGIGIHIGKAVCGTVKIGDNDHTVIMGYPVNIASRLESATRENNNTLIVSEKIYRLLDNRNIAESRSINVKGVSGPIKIFLMGKPFAEPS